MSLKPYATVVLACASLMLADCAKHTPPIDESGLGTQNESDQSGDRVAQERLAADRIFFDYDSAVIRGTNIDTVGAIAAALRQSPAARIVIEGHADERGTREYNLALGEKRADALRNALLAAGVNEDQITRVVSYGKERPAVVGSNEAAWAQNRRAVVVSAAAEAAQQ